MPEQIETTADEYEASLQAAGFENVRITDLSSKVYAIGRYPLQRLNEVYPFWTWRGFSIRLRFPASISPWVLNSWVTSVRNQYLLVTASKPVGYDAPRAR